jgi:DNA-binding response OmpR family regulator
MATSLKMLVVEDEEKLRTSLAQQFIDEEFSVDTADDGIPALALIAENDYDVVLLDLKLPHMDGMTLLREINKIRKFPNVIVLTAVNDVPTAKECMRLGAKDYVSKPYDPEELLNVVIRTIGGS